MIRLLVDIGNTALKVAIAKKNAITHISEAQIPWHTIEQVVIAQVGHCDQLKSIKQQAEQLNIDLYHANVTPKFADITCAYNEYQNLGIDRWLGVIASYYLYPEKHCVVVDSGTATKVDVITSQGQHLGGWILPGLDMMIASLVSNTEKVFSDNKSAFNTVLGKNTPNAVKNGALVSTLGSIRTAIAQLDCTEEELHVVFAGGNGKLLRQHFEMPSSFVDDLVFKGLLLWCNSAQK